ncbi:UTP--glucose-1-phosphate uridylyltransferase GalU [Motiliproteus sp. MSK22-1]|uniref:UTP--glucose-1-phosphate uridylyltransferase GalU n=1 Tax=Motiliproteus sp. MSK22-1 TaxID=1897630 RepID=UPI000977F30D|nr:UTP--glucose-1-phosphate uridylyltransferase GalU [Motiliproteus sp. MSK22-1]OMH31844.1 UTP--glucose-1-phosphate uridylyltransferase [Motiliproteus sp. MSK22-1]
MGQSKINTCVFPVAGFGSRFLPASKAVPKEMLPIVDKPLIQYAVEEAAAAGLKQVCFVNGRHKQAIENHFDRNFELETSVKDTDKEQLLTGINQLMDSCSFASIRQVEAKGLGHAIGCSEPIVDHQPFAVILPDDLCVNPGGESVLQQMVALYERYQCSIVAIEEVPVDQVNKYGVIDGEEEADGVFRVRTMVEKPAVDEAPSNLAIIGRYVLTPDIFKLIADTKPGKGGEIQITDALMKQAVEGRVIAYRFKGTRFDCGSVPGYVSATNYCFEQFYKS